jgi:hypothetical protein
MIAEHERYVVERCPGGVRVRMRQGRNGLRLALVALGVLIASWWFGPFGPAPVEQFGRNDLFYWVWSSFWGFILLFGVAAGFYRQDWTITRSGVTAETSFLTWARRRLVQTGPRLVLHAEPSGGEVFPFRVNIQDGGRESSGMSFEFTARRSMDDFLEVLQKELSAEVTRAASL